MMMMIIIIIIIIMVFHYYTVSRRKTALFGESWEWPVKFYVWIQSGDSSSTSLFRIYKLGNSECNTEHNTQGTQCT